MKSSKLTWKKLELSVQERWHCHAPKHLSVRPCLYRTCEIPDIPLKVSNGLTSTHSCRLSVMLMLLFAIDVLNLSRLTLNADFLEACCSAVPQLPTRWRDVLINLPCLLSSPVFWAALTSNEVECVLHAMVAQMSCLWYMMALKLLTVLAWAPEGTTEIRPLTDL